MISKGKRLTKSQSLALELYDSWIRERRKRPDIQIPKNMDELARIRKGNFLQQVAEPRRKHLHGLKEVSKEMSTADKVALLVMLEFPALEASTLLSRLNAQMAEDKNATYFSKINQAENCG